MGKICKIISTVLFAVCGFPFTGDAQQIKIGFVDISNVQEGCGTLIIKADEYIAFHHGNNTVVLYGAKPDHTDQIIADWEKKCRQDEQPTDRRLQINNQQ